MKPKILASPQAILAELKQYFSERNLGDDLEVGSDSLQLILLVEGTDTSVQVRIEPEFHRLHIFTVIAHDVVPPRDQSLELCNYLSTHNRYVSVSLPEQIGQITIESALMLGDGMCLDNQLVTAADAHFTAAASLVPLLGSFARGEIGRAEVELRLDVLTAMTEDASAMMPQDPKIDPESESNLPGLN